MDYLQTYAEDGSPVCACRNVLRMSSGSSSSSDEDDESKRERHIFQDRRNNKINDLVYERGEWACVYGGEKNGCLTYGH